jgi:uncharacterized membrane protein YcaP (DUF421 family)
MSIDWNAVFAPTVPLAELVVRGSLMYLLIFTLMRILRRDAGALSTADLLVVVLVADAAQNGMASESTSVTESAVIVATIFAWNYAFDWLGFRYSWAHRVLNPAPLLLIRDGQVIRQNLKAELLTVDDLMEQLRQQGVDDIGQVKRSFLEPDGRLSVIARQRR